MGNDSVKTILLADDHAIVRDGLHALLEFETDIRVVGEAADGFNAVREARRLRPDIVIMDIAMPELNGIEALRQVRETCPSVRVLILTMHADAEQIHQAFQAGASGYMLKECAGREVVTAIRTISNGHHYLSKRVVSTMIDDYAGERHASSPLDSLSTRERQILQLVTEGKSSAEVAKLLFLSPKTVETYRSRVMQKLEIHDFAHLVKFAVRHRLTAL